MKKITLILILLACSFGYAQVLNESANWPNTNWTLSGTYVDNDPNIFLENPTTSALFAFDDDNAGNGSNNDIAAESTVIDLTAAYNANELVINVNSTYVLRVYQTETLTLQYWDADTSSWVNWGNPLNSSTANAPTSDYCSATYASFVSADLNISGFTANQLSNFKYRIYYQDNSSYGYGFCFTSPTLTSTAPPVCPDISNLSVSNITLDSADISWTAGLSDTNWEIVIQDPVLGPPTSAGTVITTNAPYSATGLNNNTAYEVYVRGNCGNGDFSNWVGPITFNTLVLSRINFTQAPITLIGNEPFNPSAVVDMNGDFLDDIVGATADNINIQQQNADGSFTNINITTPTADFTPSWSISAADFDANGKTDLLYGNGSGVTFMQASDDGMSFTEQSTTSGQYTFSQRSNFVDINNDGKLDAFVCHDIAPNVYFLNDANGTGDLTFYQSDVTPGAPYSLGNFPDGGDYGSIWIDYNNDRNIDLFIAKCGGSTERRTNMMVTNNGDNTFTENAAILGLADPMQTWSSTWGDYDNDGDMDVFVGASSGTHKLMRNNGAPEYDFTDVTAAASISAPTGWESSSFDIDNDGYLDIIANGSIMYGKGDMTFEDADTAQINYKNGAFGDLNNDGFIDVYFDGNIYYNQGNSNNWIKINTIGMDHVTPNMSNRNGIGARVEITTSAGTQIRDVKSGEGFEFMSSLTTHFGIGSETSIDNITIYWPSGTIDFIPNPAINTTLNIQEGSALSVTDENLIDLSIYPNPVEDILKIETVADITNHIATVFDINGKLILNIKLKTNSLDVSNLESGVYFLRLSSNGKSIKRKFIKK